MMSASLRFSSCREFTSNGKLSIPWTEMICGSVMTEILEPRKFFQELISEHAPSPFFSSRITKSVTVKVTKFVFLTAALLTDSCVVQSDKRCGEIAGVVWSNPNDY